MPERVFGTHQIYLNESFAAGMLNADKTAPKKANKKSPDTVIPLLASSEITDLMHGEFPKVQKWKGYGIKEFWKMSIDDQRSCLSRANVYIYKISSLEDAEDFRDTCFNIGDCGQQDEAHTAKDSNIAGFANVDEKLDPNLKKRKQPGHIGFEESYANFDYVVPEFSNFTEAVVVPKRRRLTCKVFNLAFWN